MKKYGIISLNIYEKDNNWGSVLQSYALQKTIQRFGYDVEIVNICPKYINRFEARYPIVKLFSINPKKFIRSVRNSIFNFKTYIDRDNKFKTFIKKYYKTTPEYKFNNFPINDFEGFIIGSDIVWNIDFTKGFDDLYFCNLSEMKKLNNISYAPSMCDRKLTQIEENIFENRLMNFKHISVREKSQVDYVKKFTNNNVEAVLDPTLLLEENDYNKFILKRIINENYVLVYTVPTDKALVEFAINYAKEKNKKVVLIECLNVHKKVKDCINYNDAGIEEWLTLIKYADYIFTNSFHACIFSIIFKKQFHTVYRNPGKTKIADLCNSLDIQNFSEKQSKYSLNMNSVIDYNKIYNNLDKYRKVSLEYLQSSLKEGENDE